MHTRNPKPLLARALVATALAAGAYLAFAPARIEAQSGGVTVSISPVLAAGPDFATDVIGDAWDMSNAEDLALDPLQTAGWTNLAFSAGRLTGTLGLVNGQPNASTVAFLGRGYWGVINPDRTGSRFPIDTTRFTRLSFKMSSTRADQLPRVYWFHNSNGDPAGDGHGARFLGPSASPAGDNIFTVDLTQDLADGEAWASAPAKGFSIFPNSSAVDYKVSFDWVRLTSGDADPAAATEVITWSGGTGPVTLEVQDAGGAVFTIASGLTGTSYTWNYGILPPGAYILRIVRGAATGNTPFRINTPPTLRITDPNATGGEDFATKVLGNPWDMSDAADLGSVAQDHLVSRTFSGGQFHGISDGVPVAFAGPTPVGDPMVYPLTNNGVIDTSRYRYLTYTLQVDGAYDLGRGSVARLFWGSVPGSPYNVTVSQSLIVWPGMRSYTVDLATLAATPDGGIESGEGAAQPWTAANVRYLRLDPHEFAEQRGFHIDNIKLAAMAETAGGRFTIRFATGDADGDPVLVDLYYDNDRDPSNGRTQIASAIPGALGQFNWNTAGVPEGVYYIYAVAGDGRNVFAGYADGPVRVTASAPQSAPQMSIDAPANGATLNGAFEVKGWAADLGATAGTGVDAVHVYAYPASGQPAIFLGVAAYGQPRGDVGVYAGAQFTNSGYTLSVSSLAPGAYQIVVFARSSVSGVFQAQAVAVTVATPVSLLALDLPMPDAAVTQPFTLSGWSADPASTAGTGVDAIHVWAYPDPGSGAAPVFVGAATYGTKRPDVGASIGSRFVNSGYSIQVAGLSPGPYQFVVYSHSVATGTFTVWTTRNVTIVPSTRMVVDTPVSGAAPAQPFTISGWALDLASTSGPGVDAIHVWAYKDPGSGTPPQFVGVATYGLGRGDVGVAYRSTRFNTSGFSLTVAGLASGTYDLVVYAHSAVSHTFSDWRTIRVTVP